MQPPGASQRFGPERRLRRKAEFQRVFEHGQRIHGRFLTMIGAPGKPGTVRLGIVASRKLGNAIRRNRAKRLIRELFRRTVDPADGPALDLVVIPRRELIEAPYVTLENDFRNALRRCAGRLTRRDSH